jgi:hypothetical protein
MFATVRAVDVTTPVGIALVVLGVLLAVRVAKQALKLVFLAVVAVGLYFWFVA